MKLKMTSLRRMLLEIDALLEKMQKVEEQQSEYLDLRVKEIEVLLEFGTEGNDSMRTRKKIIELKKDLLRCFEKS